MSRTRNENNYRNTTTQNGTFSPQFDKATTARVIRYCKIKNLNKTKFAAKCINDKLDELEKEMYNGLTKDELIEILMSR